MLMQKLNQAYIYTKNINILIEDDLYMNEKEMMTANSDSGTKLGRWETRQLSCYAYNCSTVRYWEDNLLYNLLNAE